MVSKIMRGNKVNASNANGGSFTLKVYVGDTLVGTYTSNATTATLFEFELDQSLQGKVKIEFTGVNKTLYVKEIAIVGWLVYFSMYSTCYTVLYSKLKQKAMLARAIVTLIAALAFLFTLCMVTLG